MANAADNRSATGAPHQRPRTKVLVVGPVTAVGGIGQVARMSVGAMDAKRFDIATCDTTKDTPEDRSLATALWSHVRRLGNLIHGIRKHQPDLVHLHTCSYLTFYRTLIDVMVCRCMGRNYVLHIHGGLFDEFLASLRGWKKALVSNALRHAGRVIVLGHCWRTNLMRRVAGMDIAVLPNAIELAVEPSKGDAAETLRGVAFVGDLSEPKRPEDLIVAYAALPSPMRKAFPLHIVGGGTPLRKGRLRSLAMRLGIEDRVIFHGSLAHERVTRLLRSVDLFVLPSRAEGQPIALMEAMAARAASIVTGVGAIPETVTDGVEARVINPCNPLQLANAMRDLLPNADKRRSMGHAARLRVENDFATERFARNLAAIWDAEARRNAKKDAVPVPRLATTTFRSIL
ncbi:MAG: glycosyltransferase family 4 protein [Phycisphaerales bacterium]|nr:glycosyltransferase family 4 protein [Phycisphaerales bacterium]